jgi:hypothetical protein
MNAGVKLADERADDLRERARRYVHLAFAAPPPGDLAAAMADLGASLVRAHGAQLSVELPGSDALPFLAALERSAALPAPVAIDYGHLSLADLYRDLYGVEGV